jgi:hypothetical protein
MFRFFQVADIRICELEIKFVRQFMLRSHNLHNLTVFRRPIILPQLSVPPSLMRICKLMKKKSTKVIYTPANEPYLGRESVHTLDKLIVIALDMSSETAKRTREIIGTGLQDAACQLIPQGLSLVLSIRELVRQGYLFGGLVLLRPLAERAVTIHYLLRFPEALSIWSNGWKYHERPRLPKMIDRLADGSGLENIGRPLANVMNSITHGDPDSSIFNIVGIGDGTKGYAVSKMLQNAPLCDKICSDTVSFMVMLIAANSAIFPSHSEQH